MTMASYQLTNAQSEWINDTSDPGNVLLPPQMRPRWICLSVSPLQSEIFDRFQLDFAVPRQWLRQRPAAPIADGLVEGSLVADEFLQTQFAQGILPSGQQEQVRSAMMVKLFGEFFNVRRHHMLPGAQNGLDFYSVALSSVAIWRSGLDVNNPSLGRVKALLVSGDFKIWTNAGLNAKNPGNELFLGPVKETLDITAWLRSLWPSDVEIPGAVYIGADKYQFDLVSRQASGQRRRTRVDRVSRGRFSRPETPNVEETWELWKAIPCPYRPENDRPEELTQKVIKELQDQLLGIQSPVTILTNPTSASDTGLYYRLTTRQQQTSLETIYRPGVTLSFTDNSSGLTMRRPTIWSPASLTVTGTSKRDYRFTSLDIIGSPRTQTLSPEVDLTWTVDKNPATLRINKLPELVGRGVVAGHEIQGDTVWVRTALDWDAAAPGVPVPQVAWTAFHLPDLPVDADSLVPAFGESPIQIDAGMGYQLEISPRLEVDSNVTHVGILEAVFTIDKSSGSPKVEVRLQLEKAHAAALSPSLRAFNGVLLAPFSPPNVANPANETRTTRLRFTSEELPKLPVQLETELQHLRLIFKQGFQVVARNNKAAPFAVTTYLPYPQAIVESLSWSKENQRVRRDGTTGRVQVDRDVNVGLTAWSVNKFTFETDAVVMTVHHTDHVTLISIASGVMTELPQVFLQDVSSVRPSPETAKLRLFHRSLLIERGEFAVASEDRNLPQGPSATPHSESDMIAAVRDAFASAVTELSRDEDSPKEIENWLPGARLSGDMALPVAWFDQPREAASTAELLPRVHLKDKNKRDPLQTLRLIQHHEKSTFGGWLRFNANWTGVDPNGHRPRIELKVPPQKEVPPRNRIDAGTAPMLFRHPTLTSI